MKKLFILASVLFVGLTLTACGSNNSQDKTNASLKAENSSLRKAENESIVGSYKDDQDGAAITLNSDHTGRYVYADYVDSDTDDQLTWKKDSNGTYTITLQDSNVTGSLTGKLEGTKLILSGDSNWNTEEFIKVKGNLDLDKFLADKHRSSNSNNSNSNNSNSNSGNTNNGQETPLVKNGNTYWPKYDENGQIAGWMVKGPDGRVHGGGDPSPFWQNIESEYNALNNK